MNKVAESLVTIAERDLGAAAILLPLSSRHAAIWVYDAGAKLLEAIVRVDLNPADVARGQIERLVRRLPVGSPFATDVWDQIDPTWAADAYDVLIGEDGTIAPDPPEHDVRQVLEQLRGLLRAIRDHVRTTSRQSSARHVEGRPRVPEPHPSANAIGLADDLVRGVRDETGLISAERLAEVLDIGIVDLARLTRISPVTLRDRSASVDVQSKLTAIADIMTKAFDLFAGGPLAAIRWFKYEPLDPLDNRTAGQLVEAGHADAVLDYLELIENGVLG